MIMRARILLAILVLTSFLACGGGGGDPAIVDSKDPSSSQAIKNLEKSIIQKDK